MPRPMTFAISAAFIGVISLLVLLVFFKRDKRPNPGRSDESSPLTRPASPEREVVNEKSKPLFPPVADPRPVLQAPAKPDARALSDEESLAQLHDLAASDPNLSLKIAREAVSRFPDSPNA